MFFDIRDENKAAKSLEKLTGVIAECWLAERELNINRIDFTDEDKDIERIIEQNNGHWC